MSATLDKAICMIDELLNLLEQEAKSSAAKPVTPAPQPARQSASQPARQETASTGEEAKPTPRAKKQKVKKDAAASAAKKPWQKEAKEQASPADVFAQADLRVARIVAVEAVENSDKLWQCQVEVGEDKPRQIVAGLQQFLPREVMLGLMVVTVCNLKPAKLAGQLSEAMILAASAEAANGERLVRTLQPPPDAKPGDQVYHEGEEPHTAAPKVLKTKVWQEVVAKLSVGGSRPLYDSKPFCTSSGPVTVSNDIPDGSSIS